MVTFYTPGYDAIRDDLIAAKDNFAELKNQSTNMCNRLNPSNMLHSSECNKTRCTLSGAQFTDLNRGNCTTNYLESGQSCQPICKDTTKMPDGPLICGSGQLKWPTCRNDGAMFGWVYYKENTLCELRCVMWKGLLFDNFKDEDIVLASEQWTGLCTQLVN